MEPALTCHCEQTAEETRGWGSRVYLRAVCFKAGILVVNPVLYIKSRHTNVNLAVYTHIYDVCFSVGTLPKNHFHRAHAGKNTEVKNSFYSFSLSLCFLSLC